jgi:AraC family transcriptional regulator, regulatory protein of adaptative response / methylated-DNA-[protein]-cysteine methyltransferase
MNAPTAILERDITPAGSDYDIVRRVIERIGQDYRDQPSLDELAEEAGMTPTAFLRRRLADGTGVIDER